MVRYLANVQFHKSNVVIVIRLGFRIFSESILLQKEVDAALNAHGLIKVRVFNDERTSREQIYQQLCDELGAAPIQHIGKLLVLWRPIPEKTKAIDEDRMPGPRDVKVLKFGRPGQKPEVKQLRVLGNQRLTAGGQIKRSKPKQKSVKKGRLD